MLLNELKQEIAQKIKNDSLSRKQKICIEQAILKDLIESQGKCVKCDRIENLTLDHIIPQAILTTFGVDIEREVIEGNYQLLCKLCNTFKASRLDFANPKTKKLLLELLEKI